MRKLFLLFLFAPLTVLAQIGQYRTDLAVGINGGMMMNTISFVPSVSQNQLMDVTGGLTLRYTCEKYFSSVCAITAEFNYAQMGWKESILDMNDQPVYYVDDPDQTDPLRYTRHVNYFQIPVMARLGWGRERKGFQGFIVLGPQIATFLGESVKTNVVRGQATVTERSSKIVAQDSLPIQRKFDYGIVVGAGVEWSHSKVGHFMLEGRYYYGLGDFFDNSKSDFFGRSNFGQIVVKATWLFDLIRTKNDRIK